MSKVNVRIPTVLRVHVGGESTVSGEGATVGEVISGLVETHPGLKPNLLDDEGGVRKFVNVYVNDEDIRFLEKLDTSVADGDEVALLPAVAGG